MSKNKKSATHTMPFKTATGVHLEKSTIPHKGIILINVVLLRKYRSYINKVFNALKGRTAKISTGLYIQKGIRSSIMAEIPSIKTAGIIEIHKNLYTSATGRKVVLPLFPYHYWLIRTRIQYFLRKTPGSNCQIRLKNGKELHSWWWFVIVIG